MFSIFSESHSLHLLTEIYVWRLSCVLLPCYCYLGVTVELDPVVCVGGGLVSFCLCNCRLSSSCVLIDLSDVDQRQLNSIVGFLCLFQGWRKGGDPHSSCVAEETESMKGWTYSRYSAIQALSKCSGYSSHTGLRHSVFCFICLSLLFFVSFHSTWNSFHHRLSVTFHLWPLAPSLTWAPSGVLECHDSDVPVVVQNVSRRCWHVCAHVAGHVALLQKCARWFLTIHKITK